VYLPLLLLLLWDWVAARTLGSGGTKLRAGARKGEVQVLTSRKKEEGGAEEL